MKKRPAKRIPHHHLYKHKIAWLNPVERFIDKSIPYLLIILGLLLIAENPFWTLYSLEHLEPGISYFDYLILAFFVVDLTFKWFHVRKVLKFVKLYWIDLLAVMPFYLGFRIYARIASVLQAGETIAEAQRVAHEAVLIREARLLREAELLRTSRPLTQWLRTIGRSFRFFASRQEAIRHGFRSVVLKRE